MSTHSRRTDYETDGEFYQQEFYEVNLGPKSLGHITQYTKSRDEAYTKLKIRPPGIRAKDCTLWLKIHTGASGNTLTVRTFLQIYWTHYFDILEPARNVRLTEYNMARSLNVLERSTCTTATKMRSGQRKLSTFLMCQGLQLLVFPPANS